MWSRPSPPLVLGFIAGAVLGYLSSRLYHPVTPASEIRATAAPAIGRDRLGPSADTRAVEIAARNESVFARDPGKLDDVILSAVRRRNFFARRHAIFEIAASMDAAAVAGAMQRAESFSVQDRDSAQSTLLARWLDLEPASALQWVIALNATDHRDFLLRETFSLLGANDPVNALEHLASVQGSVPIKVDSYRHEIFRSWAQSDPGAAFQYALGLTLRDDRSSAIGSTLETWATQDPKGAIAALRTMSDQAAREESYLTVLGSWAERNPEEAANDVLALPPGNQRAAAIIKVIKGASEQDQELTHELIAMVPPGSARDSMLSDLVSDLSDSDPRSATEYLELLPANRQQIASSIARNYAKQDLSGALEWASSLASDELRSSSLSEVVQQWAARDRMAAVAYADQHLTKYPNAFAEVLASWAEEDPRAAIAHAQGSPDLKARDEALARCIRVWARTQPEQALQAAEKLSGTTRETALASVANEWAYNDPRAAANTLLGSPEPHRFEAISSVMATWSRAAPAQAAEWLQTIPAGTRRDTVVAAFVQAVTEADPSTAAAWAVTLQDPKKRDETIQSVAYGWMQHDKAAALEWLKQTPSLSEAVRARMLSEHRQRETSE